MQEKDGVKTEPQQFVSNVPWDLGQVGCSLFPWKLRRQDVEPQNKGHGAHRWKPCASVCMRVWCTDTRQCTLVHHLLYSLWIVTAAVGKDA